MHSFSTCKYAKVLTCSCVCFFFAAVVLLGMLREKRGGRGEGDMHGL